MNGGTPERENGPEGPSVVREPKFCRCRICHEHFYGETVAEAHRACLAHRRKAHPDWADATCYCPD